MHHTAGLSSQEQRSDNTGIKPEVSVHITRKQLVRYFLSNLSKLSGRVLKILRKNNQVDHDNILSRGIVNTHMNIFYIYMICIDIVSSLFTHLVNAETNDDVIETPSC